MIQFFYLLNDKKLKISLHLNNQFTTIIIIIFFYDFKVGTNQVPCVPFLGISMTLTSTCTINIIIIYSSLYPFH